MANINLVVNSKYDPFTLQELMGVTNQWELKHTALQESLSDYEAKASVWDGMANKQTDKRTYEQYKKFADDLRAKANRLYYEGATNAVTRELMKTKGEYSEKIVPIEKAYERRKTLADEQRKGRAQGLIYDYDAATTSLDKFVFDNQKDYESIDLRNLEDRAMKEFAPYAQELREFDRTKDYKRLDAFHNLFIQKYGRDSAQVAAFQDAIRRGDTAAITDMALKGTYDSLYNSTGVQNWKNAEAEKQVQNTLLRAVGQSIGTTKQTPMEDVGAKIRAQEESEKRVAQFKYTLEHPNPTTEVDPNLAPLDGFLEGQGLGKDNIALLSVLGNSKGASSYESYAGHVKGNAYKVDPLYIYQEFQKLRSKYGDKKYTRQEGPMTTTATTTTGKYTTIHTKAGDAKALKEIKQKYAVSKVLSDSEVKALKTLGYESKYIRYNKDHQLSMLNKLNSTVRSYQPLDINVTDYEKAGGSTIRGALLSSNSIYDGSADKLGVRVLNPNGTVSTRTTSLEKILGEDGKSTIRSIATFGTRTPGYIYLKTDLGEFAVPYKYLQNTRIEKKLEEFDEDIRRAKSSDLKNQIAERQALYLRAALDGREQVQPTTNSALGTSKPE